MDGVWDENWYGSTKTLDVHIRDSPHETRRGGRPTRLGPVVDATHIPPCAATAIGSTPPARICYPIAPSPRGHRGRTPRINESSPWRCWPRRWRRARHRPAGLVGGTQLPRRRAAELERVADKAAIGVAADLFNGPFTGELAPSVDTSLALYAADARRLDGQGPQTADSVVQQTLDDKTVNQDTVAGGSCGLRRAGRDPHHRGLPKYPARLGAHARPRSRHPRSDLARRPMAGATTGPPTRPAAAAATGSGTVTSRFAPSPAASPKSIASTTHWTGPQRASQTSSTRTRHHRQRLPPTAHP